MARRTLILAALLASAGCGATAPADDSAAPGTAALPALAGASTRGGTFSLRDVRGSPVVLVFVRGSFCPLCVERLRTLATYEGSYADAGARVVAVTLDSPAVARATADRLGLPFPLISGDPPAFQRWGLLGPGQPMPVPGDFILDPAGRMRYRRIGADAADAASDVALLGVLDSLRAAGALAAR